MKKTFFPKAFASLSVLLLAAAVHAQDADANQPSSGDPHSANSKVRIVRLSEVRGVVQLDRRTGRGFESAMANMPIVEGNQLRTAAGVAEVEFEDNSTLRLAPDSLAEFPRLDRLPTGTTASSVHLMQGMAYVSILKKSTDQYTLLLGERELNLPPASHLRLQIEGSQAMLAVLDGSVRIDSPQGPVDVTKKKTAVLQMLDQSRPTMAKDIAPSEFDSWDQTSVGYHSRAAAYSALNSPYAYGSNDMMYYGSFINASGCGSMWRPYFASAAWDPFSNGAWAWYPGAGYSWVSPYPWGWTPYHYGSWSYCNGAGWGWLPGGAWNGLNNVAILPPNPGMGTIPRPPIHSPRLGEPTLRAVNLRPLVHSELSSDDKFIFRKDSAGAGIPRDTLGHLDKLSRQAETHGVATTPVFVSSPNPGNEHVSNSNTLAPGVHRGSAPPPTSVHQQSPQGGYSGHPSQSGSGGPNQGQPSMTPRPTGGGGSPPPSPSPSPHK